MSIFDHERALFGHKNGMGILKLNDLKESLGISGGVPGQAAHGVVTPYWGVVGGNGTDQNRHCLIDKLKTDDYFSKWVGRISAVPDYLLDDVCSGTFDLNMITEQEATAAKEFLIYRRDNIRKLVNSNRSEFSGINEWGLPL